MRERRRPPLALIVGGTLLVVLALPVLGMAAVVVITREPGELATSLNNNAALVAFAVALVLGATALVGYALWRGIAGPVEALAERAAQVADRGARFEPPEHYGTRELAQLGDAFGATVDELQRRSRTIETFSTHLAHELKSPLTSIRGAAELLADAGDEMTPERRARFLGNIAADANRMDALVARLRELARADVTIAEGHARLSEVLSDLGNDHPGLRLSVEGQGIALPMPRETLAMTLHHLADNAVRHGARTLHVVAGEGSLSVENDGRPIASGDRDRVLDPFFTTRRDEGGTGLGLSIAAALVEQAGGTLSLATIEPVRFVIRFGGDAAGGR